MIEKCPCCRAVDEWDCGCSPEMIKAARDYLAIKHFGDPCGRRRLAFGLAERVYARRWAKANRRICWLNRGYGALEAILGQYVMVPARRLCRSHGWGCSSRKPGKPRWGEELRTIPAVITQRDATVAASVIQWLGTNCGQAFVREAEREIAQKRANSTPLLSTCPECGTHAVRFRMGDATDLQRQCAAPRCGHTWDISETEVSKPN